MSFFNQIERLTELKNKFKLMNFRREMIRRCDVVKVENWITMRRR